MGKTRHKMININFIMITNINSSANRHTLYDEEGKLVQVEGKLFSSLSGKFDARPFEIDAHTLKLYYASSSAVKQTTPLCVCIDWHHLSIDTESHVYPIVYRSRRDPREQMVVNTFVYVYSTPSSEFSVLYNRPLVTDASARKYHFTSAISIGYVTFKAALSNRYLYTKSLVLLTSWLISAAIYSFETQKGISLADLVQKDIREWRHSVEIY